MSEQADRVRNERQLWAVPGSSHDRLIAMLRAVLPMGIGVTVALLAMAPLAIGRDISFVLAKDRVAIAHERMRVTDASYSGQDSKGKPFRLSAKSAVQLTSRDPIVKLTGLTARIMLDDGPVAIAANQGRYDLEREKVTIDGPVLFKTWDDYSILTHDVAVDLKTRTVASAGAVQGTMPLGTFRADRLRADLGQHIAVLEGGARLHIVQGQSRGKR